MIANSMILVILIAILAIALLFQSTIFAKVVGTSETTVTRKKVQNTVIYTGVFVPIKQYIIITSDFREIIVQRREYDVIKEGDQVTVNVYSNGRHRLQG